jgi:hypothetical protein
VVVASARPEPTQPLSAPLPTPLLAMKDPPAEMEDTLRAMEVTLAEMAMDATNATDSYHAVAAGLTTALAATSADDRALEDMRAMMARLEAPVKHLETTVKHLAATTAALGASLAGAAGTSPAAAQVVRDAQALVKRMRGVARSARTELTDLTEAARGFLDAHDDSVQALIALAETSIAHSEYAAARRHLDAAARKLPRGTRIASLDFTYGLLYQRTADAMEDPESRAMMEQQAIAAYGKVMRAGQHGLRARAMQRVMEIFEDAQTARP